MLFNSIDFAVFLPVVFSIYWLISGKRIVIQNLFLIVASYVFYAWWDWRFLSLIMISTFADYTAGIYLGKERNATKRKLLLSASIIVNLVLLGFFKYYNFFIESVGSAFTVLGFQLNTNSLHIILPIGISFYTFQTLSYTIDVYRNKIEHIRNFIAFAAFVSFFPQLVAGPIERASSLLYQFCANRDFNYNKAVDGMRQILWGLFKKIVIADNCAVYANMIFNNNEAYAGSTLFLGAVFFSFQIYGDFSGYSDIAIGTARLFGFTLKQNFAFPYFSRDMAEFWRRWHISLSTWFRDYLYIPLGGSRGSNLKIIRNTLIIFIVSGLWHGANWTFVLWGAINATYFLPLILLKRNRNNLDIVAKGKILPSLGETASIGVTFGLTVIAWILFRAENLSHAVHYLSGLFDLSLFTLPEIRPKPTAVLVAVFLLFEWFGRENQYAIEKLALTWKRPFRWALYYGIAMCIFFYAGNEQAFIYFQF